MTDPRKLLIEARKMLDHFLGDDSCMCQACLLCRSIDAALAEKVEPVATRDEVLAMAEQAGGAYDGYGCMSLWGESIVKFHALAFEAGRKAEREECAKDKVDAERLHWCIEHQRFPSKARPVTTAVLPTWTCASPNGFMQFEGNTAIEAIDRARSENES